MQFDYWFLVPLMLIGVKTTFGDFVHNVSVHVIDVHIGKPASGMKVSMLKLDDYYHETLVSVGTTDAKGKVKEFTSKCVDFVEGLYKLRFNTKEYFVDTNRTTFYPFIDIVFEVNDRDLPYHIPLLLNAYSYSTYRGSLKYNLQGSSKPAN